LPRLNCSIDQAIHAKLTAADLVGVYRGDGWGTFLQFRYVAIVIAASGKKEGK
jgi:hypothetical protein